MKIIMGAALFLTACATTDPGYLQRVQAYQAAQRPAYVVPSPPQMIPNHSPPNYLCTPTAQNNWYCSAQ